MKPKILYGDTDSFMPLYPRAMRGAFGHGKMAAAIFLASLQAYRQMMFPNTYHPLNPENLDRCRKCLEKQHGPDIACDRYVQCVVGADETSEYVRGTSKLLKELSVVFNIKKVKE